MSVQCPPDCRVSVNQAGTVRFHRVRANGRTYCGKHRLAELAPPGGWYPDGARACGLCDRLAAMRPEQGAPPA